MKIVKFDKSKAPTAIANALKGKHEIIDLSDVTAFDYEHFWHMKSSDFFLNNGTFGSKHPKRQWLPNAENHKMAVMNHRNEMVNMFAKHFNKNIIHLESATLSRMKCNYINKFYKVIPPRFYRMGLNHWVFSHTKWCKPIKGRLEKNLKLIEEENKFTFKNVFNHQWKNNKDGYIVILPGLEDDPTSSVRVDKFVANAVKTIRQYTDRKIIVKAHPHSKLTYENLDVKVMTGSNRLVDLAKDIYCAVLDNTDLSKIENLHYASSEEVLNWYEQMASTEFLMSEFADEDFITPRIVELLDE